MDRVSPASPFPSSRAALPARLRSLAKASPAAGILPTVTTLVGRDATHLAQLVQRLWTFAEVGAYLKNHARNFTMLRLYAELFPDAWAASTAPLYPEGAGLSAREDEFMHLIHTHCFPLEYLCGACDPFYDDEDEALLRTIPYERCMIRSRCCEEEEPFDVRCQRPGHQVVLALIGWYPPDPDEDQFLHGWDNALTTRYPDDFAVPRPPCHPGHPGHPGNDQGTDGEDEGAERADGDSLEDAGSDHDFGGFARIYEGRESEVVHDPCEGGDDDLPSPLRRVFHRLKPLLKASYYSRDHWAQLVEQNGVPAPLCWIPDALEYLVAETGNPFIDANFCCHAYHYTYDWTRQNVDLLTQAWQEAQALERHTDELATWIEQDCVSHTREVIALWLQLNLISAPIRRHQPSYRQKLTTESWLSPAAALGTKVMTMQEFVSGAGFAQEAAVQARLLSRMWVAPHDPGPGNMLMKHPALTTQEVAALTRPSPPSPPTPSVLSTGPHDLRRLVGRSLIHTAD